MGVGNIGFATPVWFEGASSGAAEKRAVNFKYHEYFEHMFLKRRNFKTGGRNCLHQEGKNFPQIWYRHLKNSRFQHGDMKQVPY
jgi:hypothetical protein